MSEYQNMGRPRQYDISMLVLQLQELVTFDEHSSLVITNHKDTFDVRAPTNSTLKKESQKRLKSNIEKVHAAISSKKIKSIQRMGIRQTVALDLNEIEVMATAKRHCSFCNNEHGVNTCGKLKLMYMKT